MLCIWSARSAAILQLYLRSSFECPARKHKKIIPMHYLFCYQTQWLLNWAAMWSLLCSMDSRMPVWVCGINRLPLTLPTRTSTSDFSRCFSKFTAAQPQCRMNSFFLKWCNINTSTSMGLTKDVRKCCFTVFFHASFVNRIL